MSNAEQIVLYIQIGFYGLVFIPYFIYVMLVYRQLTTSSNPAYSQRIPSLIFLQCALQFIAATRAVLWDPTSCIFKYCEPEYTSTKLHQIIRFNAIVPMLYVLFLRIYFVYFKTKYNYIVTNSEWWQHINAQFDKTNNFYIKHIQDIGSFRYMSKYCALIILGISIIHVLVTLQNETIGSLMTTLVNPIFLFVSLVLLYKMPVFDSYYIRRELLYTNIILAITNVFWFIVGAKGSHYKNYIISNIGGYVTMIGCMAFCAMAVLYPRYKCGSLEGSGYDKNQRQISEDAKLPRSWSRFVEMHSSNFISFMQFLVRELAVENLAFIMEVVQIKQQFIGSNLNEETVTGGDVDNGYLLNLPKDLPQSSLLDIKDDLDKQWALIYNKYIVSDAGLAVNISAETRGKCASDMESISDFNDNDKLIMYDDCLVQLHRLLNYSYFRYRRITTDDPKLLENLVLMNDLAV